MDKKDLLPSQIEVSRPRRRLNTNLVITELLNQPTLAATAEVLGVGRTTLWRSMKRPEFRAAFQQASAETFQNASSQLQHVASQAIDKLDELMHDWSVSPWARICAATAAVQLAFKSLAFRQAERPASIPPVAPPVSPQEETTHDE